MKAPALDMDFGIMLICHELFHLQDQLARGLGSYLFACIRGRRPAYINNGSSHPWSAMLTLVAVKYCG